AVADQVLSLLIREIVERLQHHDLELQDRIVGLAASVALTLLGLRLGHALDVSAEVLPPHDLLDRFQRITFGADRLKPALNIEKARLPHDSLAPSAHGPLPSASQIRSDLARRIFRGALELSTKLLPLVAALNPGVNDFADAKDMRGIGIALLKSVGCAEFDMDETMIADALEANDTFIERLQGIRAKAEGARN